MTQSHTPSDQPRQDRQDRLENLQRRQNRQDRQNRQNDPGEGWDSGRGEGKNQDSTEVTEKYEKLVLGTLAKPMAETGIRLIGDPESGKLRADLDKKEEELAAKVKECEDLQQRLKVTQTRIFKRRISRFQRACNSALSRHNLHPHFAWRPAI